MTTLDQPTRSGATQRPVAGTRRPLAAVLAAVGIPMFMVTLDNLVVTTALPVIREELGASLGHLQWFVNAYTLPFAALLLTAAALGDRMGRRRLFLVGIALFTLASAACALATEPWMLITARALQGVGGAAVMPLSLTLLATAVPDRLRDPAIGIWGGISGLGVAVGPVVGGAVVKGLDWSWIFWLNVPVGLVAIVLARLVLTESRAAATRLDPLGLLLSATGVLALVWGVIRGQEHGWTAGPTLAALIAGGVLLVLFVGWERRTPTPMLPMGLFRSRGFRNVNGVTLAFSVGVFGSVFLLAQFFQVAQGQSPLGAGLRTMPWTMAPMVVAPIAGLIVNRVGARTLIVTGQALLAAALGWIAIVASPDVAYASLVPPFLLAGVGMGLTFAPTSTLALASVSPEAQGVASGTLNTIRELGVAIGVAALASIFVANGGYGSSEAFTDGLVAAVGVGAAVVALGALLALRLPGRGR
ncbi:DHA2 family efflux MFS transporter permease subunit [Micromonospora krabiensis]|uniref:Drug resistance transporter, EmrB/QacA subfamily n=1 Tax=Micromonospora krabiensis TaxID=307121 RepID=A0A1C3MXU5_9ACTN|nr:DHA2 family efflux MFS transporter permease subunit [Micromonospora krabiensis]SBV25124.1 drug resistance transporter, EmrB/QacA subfamily [Micromonospora krabiensis]